MAGFLCFQTKECSKFEHHYHNNPVSVVHVGVFTCCMFVVTVYISLLKKLQKK